MSDAMLRRMMVLQRLPIYPRKTSTRQLLSSLEDQGITCTIRTVQRDLDFLSASGLFGIGADTESKPAGWYWMQGGKDSEFSFMNRSTAVAFAMMRPMLTDQLPTAVTEKLSGYVEQAEKFIAHERGWAKKVYLYDVSNPHPRGLESNALDTICEALDSNLCLSFELGKYIQGIDLSYIQLDPVHPLGLISSGATLYLAHYLGGHRRVVLAPVHHMKKIEILADQVCEEAETFDINEYVHLSDLSKVFNRNVSHKIMVNIKTARFLKENPLADNQNIELHKDDICSVSFVANDTAYLRARLKSLEIN